MAMTLRLTQDQHEALAQAAEREGRSMHQVAVDAIERYVSERNQERDALLARLVVDNKQLLDRLGSV